MSTPGNGDYRLREIERRLQSIEDRGSPATRQLLDRLDAEKEARKQAISDLQRDIQALDNNLTWLIRSIAAVVFIAIGAVLIAVLSGVSGG